ncbi:SsgA family sporulation/cell division regulator [Streptomyces sp. AM2-3-1]|uniref:SsgA family sporulation/cell division regulator n=1 Tax=Streptomyces sp. AM2-3-1 TaxID=3075824 RepID=UPI0028C4BC66|nr:SsgA family sporulation/cell division regulator [Streptomyces sp. AM2-3-1]WNO62330.1 SsgA family sporulation/cell division regulator [Streptomyces sp. AM2-3-1]WNO69616.1 SsgA family sporulation/cell division regulator [Streptomyces sp. AM2-3-1]
MKSLRTVVYELPVRLVVSRDLSMPLPMGLQYEASDPYAVRAALYPLGHGGTVEWFFSRDMLAQALRGHAGHGDVRMWSGEGLGRDVLYIALSPPAGSILLEVPAQGVESFLRETRSVVPPGAESGQLDLDAELAHLLTGS